MTIAWTSWNTFPDTSSGMRLSAPEGPGLFEVRQIASGVQVAFAASVNVAASLATLVQPPASGLRSIFARKRIVHRPIDLEYRVCAAATIKDARAEEDRLNGLRRAYLYRRAASGRS